MAKWAVAVVAAVEFVAVAAGVWLEYTASVAAEAAVVTAPAVGSAAGFAGVTIAAATVVAAAVAKRPLHWRFQPVVGLALPAG